MFIITSKYNYKYIQDTVRMLIETALTIIIIIVVITEFIKSVYPYTNKKEMFQENYLMMHNLDPSFRLTDVKEMSWRQ